MSQEREIIYSVRGPKTIYEMTGYEFDEMSKLTDICLVATGSVEQHGQHAPLGMDGILGTDVARRTAAKLADAGMPVFIAPPIPLGTTPYLADLPGTISISVDTFRSPLKEICFGLNRHGIRRFAFILGHSGNFPTMQVAGEEITQESDSEVVVLNWIPYVMGEAAKAELLHEGGRGAHGGESETARVMATHPELVDLSKARVAWFPEEESEPLPFAQPPFVVVGFDRMRKTYLDYMPNGSTGDPAKATAETGEKLYGFAAEWCSRLIKRQFSASQPAISKVRAPR